MYIKTLTVSALNNYIKKVLDNDFIISNSSVKGEISNFKIHSSGHIYFSLKDEFSKINCIMFRSAAQELKFIPETGMKVVVKGKISVYEKDGVYQLYCTQMEPEGMGELYLAFEKLKNRLKAQGLFDIEHKRPIPLYANKIGVITSPTGAAIRDIINVTKRRNSNIELLIYPALVQGLNASLDIIKGIKYLNNLDNIDVIILARGGGSIEELWCFNDEDLAHAVYNSRKPIITGVGHETDYTIVDFVSDRRAPTPSAAAEIAVFSLDEFKNRVLNYKYMLNSIMITNIKNKKDILELLRKNLEANSLVMQIVNEYNNVDRLRELLNFKIKGRLDREKEKLEKVNGLLIAHNPLNILRKGYSIIEDEDKKIVGKVSRLRELEKVKITLGDGSAYVKIKIQD